MTIRKYVRFFRWIALLQIKDNSSIYSKVILRTMVVRKDELEASLRNEKELIESGILKEDNPLDISDNFRKLCESCRRGDLKSCQEMIMTEGVNINARDQFDYTPLILVRKRVSY